MSIHFMTKQLCSLVGSQTHHLWVHRHQVIRPVKSRTVRPYKKSCVSGNPTLPIGTGRPQTFFTKILLFFFVGVFIIKVSILKKTQSQPYLNFLNCCPKHNYFFWPNEETSKFVNKAQRTSLTLCRELQHFHSCHGQCLFDRFQYLSCYNVYVLTKPPPNICAFLASVFT